MPAAGFVISAAEWVLFFVCYSLHLSDVFFASFFCALPVLVTGKIHIDGLIDTCDALGSHGAREKKLQILDDPHAGAFGIAGAVVYFLLFFGVGDSVAVALRTAKPEELEQAVSVLRRQLGEKYIDHMAQQFR